MEWIQKYIEFWNNQDIEGLISLFHAKQCQFIDIPFEGGVGAEYAIRMMPPEENAQMQLRFHIREGTKHVARVLYYKKGAISELNEKTRKLEWEYPTQLFSKIFIYELLEGVCVYLYEMETPKNWCIENDQNPETRKVSDYF